jgi:hypothetical protein
MGRLKSARAALGALRAFWWGDLSTSDEAAEDPYDADRRGHIERVMDGQDEGVTLKKRLRHTSP